MRRHEQRRSRQVRLSLLGILAVVGLALLPLGSAVAAPGSGASGATPPGSGWIRTGHFVTGMAPVEVQLTPQSGSAMSLGQRVAYGKVTDYQQVAPGNYTVGVRPAGSSASTAAMLRRTLTITAGKASTVALLGTSKAPRLATLSDDLTSPAAGSARVRVISGSANASDLTIKAINGPLIASNVVLGQTTPYATVPDGDWTLQLTYKGADAMRAPITLGSGAVYTAVVLDKAKGGVGTALITDAQGAATMPKGGAATGGGGTALASARSADDGWLLGAGGLGALLIVLGAVGVRRAPRRLTAGS